jgi:Mg-chelatase subunit ChlI
MPFPLDVDGFLDSSAAVASSADNLTSGTLIAPAVAARAGALVLLGEPGVGKTTVFGGLTEGLPDLDDAYLGEHALLWLDADA